VSLASRLRLVAKRVLPTPLQTVIRRGRAWFDGRAHAYKARRASPTDYVMEFDHRSYRKAKAAILWDDWKRATARSLELLERFDLVRDGNTVVDYGCGVGRITRALAERYHLHILSVDRSPEMLRHARRYLPRWCLEQGTVELLLDTALLQRQPSLQGTIDSLLMIEMLQHIPEPEIDEVLPRLLLLLKPQGRLFVLGHETLDVDRQGRLGTTAVAGPLSRLARIDHQEVLATGFAEPRFLFLCSRLDITAPPAAAEEGSSANALLG